MGEMVFVGFTFALYNQNDLMALLIATGVDKLITGITGLSQINGRNEISIKRKIN